MSRISSGQSGRQMHNFTRAVLGDDALAQLAAADDAQKALYRATRYGEKIVPDLPALGLSPTAYRQQTGKSPSRFANLMGSDGGNPQVIGSAGSGAHRLPPAVEGADLSLMEEAAMSHLNSPPPPPVSKTPILKRAAPTPTSTRQLSSTADDYDPWDYTPDPELSMADLAALGGDDIDIPPVFYDDEPPTFNSQLFQQPPSQPFIPTSSRASTPYSNLGVGQTDTIRTPPPPPPKPLNWMQQATEGLKRGIQWGVGDTGHYSKSVVSERAPGEEYQDLGAAGQAAYATGRVAADAAGHGSRKFFWTITPEDIVGTYGKKFLVDQGVPRIAQLGGSYAATVALGAGSGNFNPLNAMEGGRPSGYQANNPDENDPRSSTSPIYDMVVERGLLGRRGRLLPWEQFHEERPDVSYETYAKYQDYQRNKDPGLLSKATLGLVKATPDGINGPEVSIMGYGVTPMGAAAALGTLAATVYGSKRIANLMS